MRVAAYCNGVDTGGVGRVVAGRVVEAEEGAVEGGGEGGGEGGEEGDGAAGEEGFLSGVVGGGGRGLPSASVQIQLV